MLCGFQSCRRRVLCGLSALTIFTASVLSQGVGLAQGGGETDDSISSLLDKANAGDSHAQSELATDYLAGTGVPKDWGLAAKWLRAGRDEIPRQSSREIARLGNEPDSGCAEGGIPLQGLRMHAR